MYVKYCTCSENDLILLVRLDVCYVQEEMWATLKPKGSQFTFNIWQGDHVTIVKCGDEEQDPYATVEDDIGVVLRIMDVVTVDNRVLGWLTTSLTDENDGGWVPLEFVELNEPEVDNPLRVPIECNRECHNITK